ncbi:hypothetical protein HK28_03260 [Acetobacter sp. DsW_063]|nr:hypothetical protein HK28_03260 [Acetobacter sp. DsW_063]
MILRFPVKKAADGEVGGKGAEYEYRRMRAYSVFGWSLYRVGGSFEPPCLLVSCDVQDVTRLVMEPIENHHQVLLFLYCSEDAWQKIIQRLA